MFHSGAIIAVGRRHGYVSVGRRRKWGLPEMSNAIEIENATVFLGGREILHDLSLTVEHGARCFILGANGAGKTTLIKMLLGYAWPIYGARVSVLGCRFGSTNLVELRKRIAWVSPFMQQLTGTEWSGMEMVLSGIDGTLGLFRKPRPEEIDRALEFMRRFRCDKLADQSIFTMSSGEQMKIMITRALLTQPDLLVLDEPSVFLDLPGREFLLSEIAAVARELPDLTIIFVTQRTEDILPLFDRGLIMKSGRVMCSGNRDDVLNEEHLREAYGMPVRVVHNRSGRVWVVLDE